MSVSLTGNDTIAVGTRGATLRILVDLADADTGVLEFPNNLVEAKTGKNGNTIYAFNSTGKVVTLTLRIMRGTTDDKYLNGEMNSFLNDPASYVLLDGEVVKRVGDGQGNITNDVYSLDGGIIQKMPAAKENVEGDTEQAITIWQIIFANSNRGLT